MTETAVEGGKKPTGATIWLLRVTVFLIAVASCLAAGVFLYTRWQSARLTQIAPDDGGGSHLSPLQALYLRGYLAARTGDLQGPAA
ncbi:MAG: hypothetical protein ACK2UH_02575, partial [Candidatus Promineifilaceae bacterium]